MQELPSGCAEVMRTFDFSTYCVTAQAEVVSLLRSAIISGITVSGVLRCVGLDMLLDS